MQGTKEPFRPGAYYYNFICKDLIPFETKKKEYLKANSL